MKSSIISEAKINQILNKKDNWMQINNTGCDSNVYLYNNKIIKDYFRLVKNEGLVIAKDMLNNYILDTNKIIAILKSNHSSNKLLPHMIRIGGKKYIVRYNIIPQGEIITMDNTIYNIGQEYISGLNMRSLQQIRWDKISKVEDKETKALQKRLLSSQKIILDNFREFDSNFKSLRDKINQYISEQLRRKINISDPEIKPKIDNNEFIISITDIADSISAVYSS